MNAGLIEVTETVRTLSLARREIVSHRLVGGEKIQFRSVLGILWITMEGDSEDHVLSTGELFEVNGPGLLLLEALEDEAMVEMIRADSLL